MAVHSDAAALLEDAVRMAAANRLNLKCIVICRVLLI